MSNAIDILNEIPRAKAPSRNAEPDPLLNGKHDEANDVQPNDKSKFKFPALDAIIFYACSKCKARYASRFRKGWRTLDSIRGAEPAYAPSLLFCKACATFNIEQFLKIDEMN